MVELHHIYVVLYAVSTVLALVVASVAWAHRAARGAVSLAVLMVGIGIWSGADAAMWYVPTLGQQTFWLKMTNFGVWVVPVAFLTLAFDMTEMERWRTPRRIALLAIPSFVLQNSEWWNPGRAFDAAFVLHMVGPYAHYGAVPGPLHWASLAYGYSLIIVAFAIMVRAFLRSSGGRRAQAAIVLIGGLVPFVASAVTESRVLPLGDLDLAPLAFLATGALWLTAILRGALVEVLPLARGLLVEQMTDGVVVIDGQDQVVDVNPAALMMLHAGLDNTLGKPVKALLGDAEGAVALLSGSGRGHGLLSLDPDGDLRHVELAISPLDTGRAGPPPRLLTLHDVTEEQRIARELREASDAKSRFLANMSHELRTPLNSIIGFAGVMQQGLAGPLTDEQRTQMRMISRSGKHLLRLVNDVLDLSRIEADQVSLTLARFDLGALVDKVAASVEPLADAKGIRLRVGEHRGSLETVSDRGKVEQVLINLVGNAVKFTERGEVRIECTADGSGVSVAVSDTGIGIVPEELDLIMDEFYQVDQLNDMKPSGTGLGLAISRQLVKMLGGRMETESELGSGSTFRVWLPDLADGSGAGET